MWHLSVRVALCLLFLVYTIMIGGGAIARAQAPVPTLTILAPAYGATLSGSDVTVHFAVENFEIVPATIPPDAEVQHPELNKPNQGHVQMRLNRDPAVNVDSGTAYTFTNLPAGDHTLTIDLVNNDNSALVPPVTFEIEFSTVAASGSATAVPAATAIAAGVVATSGAGISPAPLPNRMPVTAAPGEWLMSETALGIGALLIVMALVAGLGITMYGQVTGFVDDICTQLRSINISRDE